MSTAFAGQSRHSTPGLDRLAVSQRRGNSFFQGDRTPGDVRNAYRVAPEVNTDPNHSRGLYLPGLGLIQTPPLTRPAFPSALAAAIAALVQGTDGQLSLHIDELADGTAAVTFGQYSGNQGAWEEVLDRAERLAQREGDKAPLGDYFVNELLRERMGSNALGLLLPGTAQSDRIVPIYNRTPLSAGDALAIFDILGRELPVTESAAQANVPAFTGLFESPQLLFHPVTGDQLPLRAPTEEDILAAREREAARQQQQPFEPARHQLPIGNIIVPDSVVRHPV